MAEPDKRKCGKTHMAMPDKREYGKTHDFVVDRPAGQKFYANSISYAGQKGIWESTRCSRQSEKKDEKLEYDKIRDFLGIQTEYDKQTHVAARTKDWGDV